MGFFVYSLANIVVWLYVYLIMMNNKIDLITSTFEDTDLEKNYLNDKWGKVKSFYSYVLIVMLIGVSLLILSLYLRGTFALKNILVPSK